MSATPTASAVGRLSGPGPPGCPAGGPEHHRGRASPPLCRSVPPGRLIPKQRNASRATAGLTWCKTRPSPSSVSLPVPRASSPTRARPFLAPYPSRLSAGRRRRPDRSLPSSSRPRPRPVRCCSSESIYVLGPPRRLPAPAAASGPDPARGAALIRRFKASDARPPSAVRPKGGELLAPHEFRSWGGWQSWPAPHRP